MLSCSCQSSIRDGQEEIEKLLIHMTRLTSYSMLWLRIKNIKVKHRKRDAGEDLVARCGRVHSQTVYAMSPSLTIWGSCSINLLVKW